MALDRRDFIKFAAGGVTGALFTPMIWQSLDDVSIWSQNWGWIPRIPRGEIARVPSVSKLCPTGCGLFIDTVNGQPFRAEGNASHPLSGGGVSPLAVSEVQLHYSPSRAKSPMKKTGDGQYQKISWDEAIKLLNDKLASLKGQKGKVAMISGDENSTLNEIFSAYLAGLGSSDYFFMPSDAAVCVKGWQDVMGGKGLVGYDLENADFVLAIGADVLESWGPAVRYGKAFDATHPIGGAATAFWAYAGPSRAPTANAADRWLPIRPGSEAALALGLAGFALAKGQGAAASDLADFGAFVRANFDPKKVEAATGLPAKEIEALADAMLKAKKPVIVVGSEMGQGMSPVAFAAGMALNVLLGRINKPGGVIAVADAAPVVKGAQTREQIYKRDLPQYLLAVESGKTPAPEVLMVYEANPVFALPQAETMAAAIKKIPFKVSFNSFMDETAMTADLVLPTAMPLERYDDHLTPVGLPFAQHSLLTPILKPVHDVRPAGDVVLASAKALGFDLGFASSQDVLKAKAKTVAGAPGFLAKDAQPAQVLAGAKPAPALKGDLWDGLTKGEAWVSTASAAQGQLSLGAKLLAASPAPADDAAFPLRLVATLELKAGVGSTGIPAHNLSTLGGNALSQGDLLVMLNSETAAKAGVKAGETVKVSGPKGEIKARVRIFEGVMPGVVVAPLNLGHSAFDAYSKGKGDNVFKALTVSAEPAAGLSVWTGSRVKIAKI